MTDVLAFQSSKTRPDVFQGRQDYRAVGPLASGKYNEVSAWVQFSLLKIVENILQRMYTVQSLDVGKPISGRQSLYNTVQGNSLLYY